MDCLFCRILDGEIPARIIAEDDSAVAFLDIAPWHRGHALVIPRRHVETVAEDPSVLSDIAPLSAAVVTLLQETVQPDGMNLLINSGATAGQEVFHVHQHIVPRYGNQPGLGAMTARDTNLGSQEALDDVWQELGGTP